MNQIMKLLKVSFFDALNCSFLSLLFLFKFSPQLVQILFFLVFKIGLISSEDSVPICKERTKVSGIMAMMEIMIL